jgi:hypothetical protein
MRWPIRNEEELDRFTKGDEERYEPEYCSDVMEEAEDDDDYLLGDEMVEELRLRGRNGGEAEEQQGAANLAQGGRRESESKFFIVCIMRWAPSPTS